MVKNNFKLILFLMFALPLCGLGTFLAKKNAKPFNITSILDADNKILKEYDQHILHYGGDNEILLMLKWDKLKYPKIPFTLINDYFQKLLVTNDLMNVTSIINSEYLTREGEQIKLRPFLKGNTLTKEGQRALDSDLYRGGFISKSGDSTIIVINPRKNLPLKRQKILIDTLHMQRQEMMTEFSGIEAHLIGTDIARFHFFDEVMLSQKTILPLIFLMIFGLLYIIFKSWKVSFLSLFIMSLANSLTTLSVVTIQKSLDPFNSFALLLVFIIATADLVHFFSSFRKTQNIDLAVKKVLRPCFLTTLTTIIGLGALMTSDIKVVKYFGLYTTIGSILCFVLTFYFLPWFIKAFNIEVKIKENTYNFQIGRRLFHLIVKHKLKVSLVFILFVICSLITSSKIKFGDNLYRKFVADHPLSKSINAFSSTYQFTGSIDIVLKPKTEVFNYFRSIDGEQSIVKLKEKLLNYPKIVEVKSLNNIQNYLRSLFPQESQKSFQDGGTKIGHSLNILDDFSVLDNYIYLGDNEMRMTILVNDLSSDGLLKTRAFIKGLGKTKQFDNFTISLQGFSNIRAMIMNDIFKSFYKSFGLSFFMIFIVFLILFRSVKWTLLAMIPNLVPLFFISGVMGALGITVEYNLVIIFSLVIGISVDDTIHFLLNLKEKHDTGIPLTIAIQSTLDETGHALIGTTSIFVVILPIFFLTNLLLFNQLAIVLGMALLLALISDIAYLPSLLLLFEKNESTIDHNNIKLKKLTEVL